MTDLVLNAICGVLLIFITATVVICIFQCADRRLAHAYFVVGGCVFGWLFSVMLYRITEDETLALFFDNLAIVFIAFLPVTLLALIAFFYKPADKSVSLQLGGNLVVYTLAERYVTDKKGQIMGSYIALTDITHCSRMQKQ